MILKILFVGMGIYNIFWTGDYLKGIVALIIYEIINITERLDKLEKNNGK